MKEAKRSSPSRPTASARHWRQWRMRRASISQARLQPLQLGRGRAPLPGAPVVGPVLRRRDERDEVHQERPLPPDRPHHLRQVRVVHPGDHHRVDLDQHPPGDQPADPLELPLREDPRRLAPAHLPPVADDPGVDPLADLGVGHVDGDRHVAHPGRHQPVDVVGEREAVGGEAERQVRCRAADPRERGVGRVRVGERVPRPGDAHHRELRHLRGDGEHLADRVLGRQPLRDHAGPALVRAVVLPVAVVALDVARRGHRHVHAREVVVRLLAVAGVIPHQRGHLRRQRRPGLVPAASRRTCSWPPGAAPRDR